MMQRVDIHHISSILEK